MVWPVTPDLLVTLAFQSYSQKLCVLLSALSPRSPLLMRGSGQKAPWQGEECAVKRDNHLEGG